MNQEVKRCKMEEETKLEFPETDECLRKFELELSKENLRSIVSRKESLQQKSENRSKIVTAIILTLMSFVSIVVVCATTTSM